MKKRIISLLMVSALTATLFAGCGSKEATTDAPADGGNTATTTPAEPKEVTVPEKLTIMVSGDLAVTVQEHQDAFIDELQKLTGIAKIDIIQPDHSAYYDVLGTTIAGGDIPDCIYLGSTYYSNYAAQGLLWDMTDAYEASDLKKRHDAKGSGVYVDSVRIDGRLYGMPVWRGGGCVTYVRNSWLDAIDGYSADKLPTTYDEYIDMLTKFKEAGLSKASYVTGGAGFVGGEAPYINYFPEFYQDAYPTFVQGSDGKWVDGFTQDSMKKALERLTKAVADGLIDKQSLDQSTADARGKFASGEYGAYTYWANHWATNLTNNIKKAAAEGEDYTITAMAPIKEVGTYINRLSPVWTVTNACENPEGAFKYFIETMQDGADCQFLWTYGVEDVHYSYKAESITSGTGDKAVTKDYEEGKFHWKNMAEKPESLYSKVHITATGNSCLVNLSNAKHEDPNAVDEAAQKAIDLFSENCRNEELTPTTDAYSEYNGDLTTLKNELIAKVVTGQMSIDDAYAQFAKEGQAMSDAIVESLNAL